MTNAGIGDRISAEMFAEIKTSNLKKFISLWRSGHPETHPPLMEQHEWEDHFLSWEESLLGKEGEPT